MEYKINTNLTLPQPKERRWSRWAELVNEMEVGDSIEFNDLKELASCRKHMRDRGYGTAQRQLKDDAWGLWRTT